MKDYGTSHFANMGTKAWKGRRCPAIYLKSVTEERLDPKISRVIYSAVFFNSSVP